MPLSCQNFLQTANSSHVHPVSWAAKGLEPQLASTMVQQDKNVPATGKGDRNSLVELTFDLLTTKAIVWTALHYFGPVISVKHAIHLKLHNDTSTDKKSYATRKDLRT